MTTDLYSSRQGSADLAESRRQAMDLARQNRLIEAEVACTMILHYWPDDFGSLTLLGQLRLRRGDGNAALDLMRRALDVNPLSPEAFRNLANTLATLERHDESIEPYRKALTIGSADAPTHNNFGLALRVVGHLTEAEEEFVAAIRLNPQVSTFYHNLCLTRKTICGDDPYLASMEKMAADAGKLSPAHQIELYFGLGKSYADLGLMERSFECFLVGNRLKRQRLVYDEYNMLRSLRQTREFLSVAQMRQRQGDGCSSELPVFILGFPRSGTRRGSIEPSGEQDGLGPPL
jgi:tetratricopeptide (TPR) repeat protein